MSSKLNKLRIKMCTNYVRLNIQNFTSEQDLLDFAAQKLSEKCNILELYAPQYCARKILNIAKKLRELTAIFDAVFIIYDRVDIAKLVDADGVLLDNECLPIKEVNKLTEGTMLLGVEVENNADAKFFAENDIDFLLANEMYEDVDVKMFLKS